MLHRPCAHALQNIQESGQVAVDVVLRMRDRVPHAGLRGQMNDLSIGCCANTRSIAAASTISAFANVNPGWLLQSGKSCRASGSGS